MECLYAPLLQQSSKEVEIHEHEFHHLRVLRVPERGRVLLSNGNGLCAVAEILQMHREYAINRVVEFRAMHNESNKRIGIAVGILDSRERFEWIVEKSTELGVREVFPLHTRYSSQKVYNQSRLEAKALAAMKQSKRSLLPYVHEALSLAAFLRLSDYQHYILCDEKGNTPQAFEESCCLIIGPEGGLSSDEIELINSRKLVMNWKLAPSRLRSETAAIAALGIVAAM